MPPKEIDELTERCWRNCQEKQKTDPSWGNLPVLGRFVPPSEIKAGLARLREERCSLARRVGGREDIGQRRLYSLLAVCSSIRGDYYLWSLDTSFRSGIGTWEACLGLICSVNSVLYLINLNWSIPLLWIPTISDRLIVKDRLLDPLAIRDVMCASVCA